MAMTIYLNGEKEEIESGMSISKLLENRKIKPEVVTVELNDEIIEKNKFQVTLLKGNDRLEFVYYMGGGSTRASTELSRMSFARSPFKSESDHPERMSRANESKDKIYVYILRCEDGSLYTGITDNVERRFQEHFSGKGSSYTKYNSPLEVVHTEEFHNLIDAQKRERQIKGWTHRKKEALISNDLQLLKRL